MNTLKILIPLILSFILVEVVVYFAQSYFLNTSETTGLIGVFIAALIGWAIVSLITYTAAKKLVIDKPVPKNSQKYYRFYRSITLGATVPIIGYIIFFAATVALTGELPSVGGGDIMTLIAGYLGGRQAAKKLLPKTEIPNTRWL